ncbi:hypothetical protein KAR48_07075 [bacterium]|nr:hypothetical protein [bacterium]
MPFCPACRFEYEKQFVKCPDCQTDLVDTLCTGKEDHGPEGEDFIALPAVNSPIEAEMVIGALEADGILAFAKTSSVVSGAFGVCGTGPVPQTVKVYVPSSKERHCLEAQNCILNACRPEDGAQSMKTE